MDRDTGIITHIIGHIKDIFNAQERLGNNISVFMSDRVYFNAVCMSLLQIGELANHLSRKFIESHSDIPWRNIIGLRNIVVHGYGQLDAKKVWSAATDDLPVLLEKCKIIIDNENK
jgi:uncharacterized protein with HEPN domain